METVNFNVISSITKLGDKLHKSKLLKSKLTRVKRTTKLLCDYLGVSEDECYFFVITFIVQMQEDTMDLREFTRYLDITSISAIQYRPLIDALTDKKIIESSYTERTKTTTFFKGRWGLKINPVIIEAIIENKIIGELKSDEFDIYQFSEKVSDFIVKRDEEGMETYELFDNVENLEVANPHLKIIESLKKMKLDINDRTLLYEMADDFVTSGLTSFNFTLKIIYDKVRYRMEKTREILDKKSKLITNDLIIINDGVFHNDITIELTEKTTSLFFGEDAKLFIKKQSIKNLISHEKIESKELYYDEILSNQVDFISRSLQDENFVSLQHRLKDQHLSKGVAAVFYGAPGTGKSETVYQIAKSTGRSIMYVDLSDTKSMWFGQSEKKIKEIFTDYTNACSKSKLKPILLFNEADGVLSKRNENKRSSVDQTQNTIQNILLEEFEKNEGIIIATTNLVDNLDSAFERRFLFKVQFNKPSFETKRQIWRSKLNWLVDTELDQLATAFTFSGGEIDNIVRKVIMEEVLSNKRPSINNIIELCKSEKLHAGNSKKLGFN
jgi:hypothetical protein